MKFAEVIISTKSKSLDKIFHYYIPDIFKDKIKIGMRAFVPFGIKNNLIEGYVIGFCDIIDIDEKLVKSIHSLPDEYCVLTENLILLAKFMSDKYYCTLTECLQCIIPKIVKEKIKRYAQINYKNKDIDEKLRNIIAKNNNQSKVILLLQEKEEALSIDEIKLALGISSSPINTLFKNNIIEIFERQVTSDIYNYNSVSNYKFNLTKEQENALDILKSKLNTKGYKKPVVLHGVTGSGKTEVYLQIIEETLKEGKQAIVLVPEISLTPQTVERFVGKFGKLVTVTHSRLSNGERFEQWKKAKNGEISIMIGPRSAIFTPFQNLGVIIIDEEHESTYKSESTPKYNTLEVSKELSRLTNCLVIYGSATPSIETYYNTTKGEYDLITMTQRVNKTLPSIKVVDMREEINNNNYSMFSKELFSAISENLQNGMQTILFLNRRGHSTFVSCRKCGYTMECSNCNVNYTYHLQNNKLVCHYCNTTINNPKTCPSCNSQYIKYFGVGTQKIEEEIKKLFPTSRILRMDLDTTYTKNSHTLILNKFKNGEADILIGTQMIAKGLDFPKVSLVGVVAADLSIHSGDYRSAENTFQLLTQVAGRAGRNKYLGKVFIQTYNPEHYSIQYAKNNDYLGFFYKEIKDRENMFYPPFSNLFLIMITGKDEQIVKEKIKILFNIISFYNKKTNFELLGPSPANIYKLNNKFRLKIIVKGEEEKRVKNFVLYCVEKFKKQNYNKDINVLLSLNPSFIQ